jgi:hypothetical protein
MLRAMSDTYDFTSSGTSSTPAQDTDTPKESNVLAKLREEVSKKIERPEIEIRVPERSSISIVFSPNVTQAQINAWRRNSGDNTKAGMDATKFACLVIGNTCRGILVDDVEVFNEDGAPLTFASPEILEMLEVTRPIPDGIKAMYGLDPHIEATALAIMEAAGYNDSVETVDPTQD